MKLKDLTQEQKDLIKQGMDFCDENDKSTEFMICYCADLANVEEMIIVDYLIHERFKKE